MDGEGVGLNWSLGQAPEWQERAQCAGTDSEAFFPEKGGSTREAKRICNRCEVKAECLDYALGHDERFGIWGGLSERERRRLRQGTASRKLPAVAIRIQALAAVGKGDRDIGADLNLSPDAVYRYRYRYEIPAGKPVGTGDGPLVKVVRKKVKGSPWQEFELHPHVGGEVR